MRAPRWLPLTLAAVLLVPGAGAVWSTAVAVSSAPAVAGTVPAATSPDPLQGLTQSLIGLLAPTAPPSPSPVAPTPTTPTAPPSPGLSASPGDVSTDSWVGVDGQVHSTSTDPVVDGIPGSGEMFSAWDFDDACRAGQECANGMAWLNRIATIIKKSGRTVAWSVPPNKTAVDRKLIDPTTAPQGACALEGMKQQASMLDTYPGVNYLPLRKLIASDPRRTYWRTDPHWTSVGASIWVDRLAHWLSPRIARAQQWRPTTASYWGLLNQYRGVSSTETEPALSPARTARVVSTKGVVPEAALPPTSVLVHTDQIDDLRWVTKTRQPTWPGHTLLIGDSFTFSSLQLMRPLFRRGEFLWFHVNDPATIANAVVHSRTVVLELLQVGVATWGRQELPALYYAVRDALRAQH